MRHVDLRRGSFLVAALACTAAVLDAESAVAQIAPRANPYAAARPVPIAPGGTYSGYTTISSYASPVFSSDLDIPFSQSSLIQAAARPGGMGGQEPDFDEPEDDTIVVDDPQKLPAPILEQLKELPDEEREKIFAAIKKSGVKVPKNMSALTAMTPEKMAAQQRAMQLLQNFTQNKELPRTTSAVLSARSERLKAAAGGKPGTEKKPLELMQLMSGEAPAEGFAELQSRLTAGDWPAVKKQLAELPPEMSGQIYTQILTMIGSGDTPLAPEEILALADAAPKKLKRSQIAQLGQMLRTSLETVDKPDAFLAALKKGNSRIGGEGAEQRIAAARLLFETPTLSEEIDRYLPSLDEAVKKKDFPIIIIHAARLFGKDREAESWKLLQQVLKTADPASMGHREALYYVTMFLPMIDPELSNPWLRETFAKDPALGLLLLSTITAQLNVGSANDDDHGNSSSSNVDADSIVSTLTALKKMVLELAPAAAAKPEVWGPSLQLVTVGWCKQLEKARELRNSPNEGRNIPPDFFAKLLAVVPDEACLKPVDPAVAWRARAATGAIAARAGDKAAFFAVLKSIVPHDPEIAAGLAENYLTEWSGRLSGSDNQNDPNSSHMQQLIQAYGGNLNSRALQRQLQWHLQNQLQHQNYGNNESNGMPLTRARQVRNLTEMRKLLDEFAVAGVKKPDEQTLVQVFGNCHSPAEVYLREDIESVFGDFAKLDPDVVAAMVEQLRQNLAGEWRRPDVQQQLGTNRSDLELAAEVDRGYALALDMLKGVVKPDSKAALLMLQGAVHFDHAEFMYGQKVDLKTYVAAREAAFANYARAHEAYAKQLKGAATVKSVDDSVQNTAGPAQARGPQFEKIIRMVQGLPDSSSDGWEIYMQWFQSALGASDLAYVTRQDEPDRDQIDKLIAAIKSLGPKQSELELTAFGEHLAHSIPQIPAHLKPHCTREALRVLGDHPAGKPLKELTELYRDLITEIELHLRVDGSGTVGQSPFGAQLSIRGTTAVMRESMTFAMLLHDGVVGQQNGQPVNYRERMEKELREKVGESFEIIQVRFHEPTIEPRTFGRDGWREMPLAYVLLRAKDAAVDKLPSVELDLTFSDGRGSVVIPINSPVQLVDARSAPKPRAATELKIKQTLDDRKLAQGTLRLEVAASGKGLLGDLRSLVALADDAGGFQVADVVDHGLVVTTLDTKSEQVRPECERRWTVEMKPTTDVVPAEFRFPTAIPPAEMTLARFDDADLATAEPTVALRGRKASPLRIGIIAGAGVGAVALLFALVYFVRRRRARNKASADARFRRPEQVTPFSVLAVLKRINADPPAEFTPAERTELAGAIQQFEDRCFAQAGATNGHDESERLLDTWLGKAAKTGRI